MSDLDAIRAKAEQRPPAPIKVNVVRSTESIDVDAWLDRYVAAILEAEGYPTSPQAEVA